jgi:hypothetical protein
MSRLVQAHLAPARHAQRRHQAKPLLGDGRRELDAARLELGGVETPFFDNPGQGRLEADDIASAVMWALDQPEHVDVSEVLIMPTAQGAVRR